MIPYQVDVPMQRWPYGNWALILLMVIVWRAVPTGFESLTLSDVLSGDVDVSPAMLSAEHFKLYQPFTSAFLHADFWHIFWNMLFLFVFGNAVNAKIGHAAFLGCFALFAYVSGLAWYLLPGGGLWALGASGAIMGVAGMFLMFYPLNAVSVFTWIVVPIVFHLSSVWLMLFFFASDLFGFLSPGGGIAYVSHLAGFLAGAGLATLLLHRGIVKPGRGEKCLLEVLGVEVAREE